MSDTIRGNGPAAVPACLHFGVCGGCQHQDLAYAAQLVQKRQTLAGLVDEVAPGIEIVTHASEHYGYRNRIRLRVQRVDGQLRFGYTLPASSQFLPIQMCPIAAPVLWRTAERLLESAARDGAVAAWLEAAAEVEFFTSDDLERVQLTLWLPNGTRLPTQQLESFLAADTIAGVGAVYVEARTNRVLREVAAAGAAGLLYRIPIAGQQDQSYWITRGGFFQVNRFLIPTLVELVTAPRAGGLAWDLFAGVGLFSRILGDPSRPYNFAQITAVEANPTAATDLRVALTRLSPAHTAVQATALEFLQRAITQRERPGLIVLDPPRAGAGAEACRLIARLAPRDLVYVSCDPVTLVRDLRVLAGSFRVTALHMLDLFPQTSHIETVAMLQRIQ